MIKVIPNHSLEQKSLPNGGTSIEFPLEGVSVRLLRYPAKSSIPKHSHTKKALHIVLKGEATLEGGAAVLKVGTNYACGGHEYGPWNVTTDLEMLVIEPNQ